MASFQRRAPAAVAPSAQSAARTPGTLLAAIDAPVPVQQQTTACSARPSATSRAAAAEAQAQSSRSSALSAPWGRTSWPAALQLRDHLLGHPDPLVRCDRDPHAAKGKQLARGRPQE